MADLFDLPAARQARDKGIERVESNALEWKDAAMQIVATLPKGREVMGDDIRKEVMDRIGEPHHSNAWGALTRRAIQLGHLKPTGGGKQSKSVKNHGHYYRTYWTS